MAVNRDLIFEEAIENAKKRIDMAARVYTSDKHQAKELLQNADQDIINALVCLSIEKPSPEAIEWARKSALKHQA